MGTLALVRSTGDPWPSDDVDFLLQVANQIAIALENSLAYRQLAEMKERLATEKLYLEDEIRLDHNIGYIIGEGPATRDILHVDSPQLRVTSSNERSDILCNVEWSKHAKWIDPMCSFPGLSRLGECPTWWPSRGVAGRPR